jgi:hypothetical protein
MSETVVELLNGPTGVVVRAVSASLCVGMLLWMVTGVRLVGDGGRQRLVVRLVVGCVCLLGLVPMVLDPVGSLQWWATSLSGLGERWR